MQLQGLFNDRHLMPEIRITQAGTTANQRFDRTRAKSQQAGQDGAAGRGIADPHLTDAQNLIALAFGIAGQVQSGLKRLDDLITGQGWLPGDIAG